MDQWKIGGITLTWLDGGVTHMDGGAMFGVVPKPLWSKKYAVNDLNQIELRTEPILVQGFGKNILIEAGIGSGKLSEKQKRNYGVHEEASIETSLNELGLTVKDIDVVLMTHMHFDHASGLTRKNGEEFVSVFENAAIHTSDIEWEELKNPNIRSRNTYWEENWKPIQHQVYTFSETFEPINGIKMVHTGGHSDGHSVIEIQTDEQTVYHLGDIMPTHAHKNPLWVLAYDDYPMTSIYEKQKWIKPDTWYFFYHDAVYRAVKWNEDGVISDSIKRMGNS
ncbi:Glyoxylase, beta-lactamase superfamily II [Fictibacillus solisalsi]|uniref:Glyoxylase, beta-lactamase superfamily II n=1 Tax=Fictibacillus solisalsi TaxID=459525 RepID=A0A1G9X338_9BACL|nr:MBL fold metallo-hydrolase [Fictibacillus solisalsi]SDM90856.1 Glyoxylase, beta-lactamase superfamily II [Fictibacillus solisalsi]